MSTLPWSRQLRAALIDTSGKGVACERLRNRQVLHGLTDIWRNCSNVDETGDALIDSRGGDGGAPP